MPSTSRIIMQHLAH